MRRLVLLFVIFYLAQLSAYVSDADKQSILGVNDFTANGGFEQGPAKWTNSGATFSVQDTTVGDGRYSASWDAAADGDTLTSDAFTIPNKLKNNNVVFCLMYKGGDENIRFIVNDGTNDFVDETLSTQTDWDLHCTNTVMPDVSTITLRLEADDDAAVIYADNFAFALAELVNIFNISQAEFYGAVRWESTASCLWSGSAGAWTSFGADADCTTPTGVNIEGNASAPATKIPAITFANMEAGRYVFKAISSFGVGGTVADARAVFRFYDGSAALEGVNGLRSFDSAAPTLSGHSSVIVGEITYTTSQSNKTFEIQYYALGGTASIDAGNVSPNELYISVYKFPTSSQQAINPSTQMVASGVKIAADADHTFSTTSATYAKATDPDVITADKTHFGTATETTTAGDFGFKIPHLKANTKFLVYARFDFRSNYISSTTTCNYIVYDGTNEIAEFALPSLSGSPLLIISYISGEISYSSVQTDLEFTVYAKRLSGGGSCDVRANSAVAEIGIIPLTEGMNSIVLETQWKQYDLTVTGTGWTTTRAVGLPYKDINGVWRLKFNIDGATSSGTRNFYSVTIAGITTSSSVQVISGMSDPATNRAYCSGSTNTCSVEHTNATTTTYRYSGDIELDSKPSWATGTWN